MKRKFSAYRFTKLIKTLAIFLTLTSIFLTIFSQYYARITYERYEAKSDYCWENHKGEYVYKIAECSTQESQQKLFWQSISQTSPKILVTLIAVDLLGYGLYRYLFPKEGVN